MINFRIFRKRCRGIRLFGSFISDNVIYNYVRKYKVLDPLSDFGTSTSKTEVVVSGPRTLRQFNNRVSSLTFVTLESVVIETLKGTKVFGERSWGLLTFFSN